MKRPPTDFELLRAIYERHRDDFQARAAAGMTARVFVPIDIPAIAADLDVEPDNVFGRLYFHLEPKYGEARIEGQPKKSLFAPRFGKEANGINFPLLEAVLANLWQERDREWRTYWTAIVSLVIAVGSLGLSVLVATGAL
jgi:hypothetical protein